jgi:hypothetical protein
VERLRIQPGPYDIFASTVGGMPYVASVALLSEPNSTPQQMASALIRNASLTTVATLLLVSYIAGTAASVFSWPVFLRAAALFRHDFRYIRGNRLQDGVVEGDQRDHLTDALITGVRETFGYAATPSRLDGRIAAYLATHGQQEILHIADNLQVMHIMARNLHLGLAILSVVSLVRTRWSEPAVVMSITLAAACVIASYGTLIRAVHFKIWHSRTLALGFYFDTIDVRRRG